MVECPTCGRDDFTSKRGMRYHHTVVHGESISHGRKTVTLTCQRCGEDYEKREDRAEESKFCSGECQRKGRSTRGKTREERNCEICDDSFEVHPNDSQQFCSRECFYKHHSEYLSGESSPFYKRIEVECDECGKTLKRSPSKIALNQNQYCSRDCYHKNYTGKDAPRWGGGAISYYGPTWQSQRRETLKRDNYECQDCGLTQEEHLEKYNRQLEIHHITPIRTFNDTTKANQLTNLITLCKSCHTQRENS